MRLNTFQEKNVTCQRKSTSCLLQYANNNRNQGRFNDVTIQSTDTSIPANRMVLSCYCSFFEQIFASETNNQVNNLVVDILDVDGKSLELLIQYIYSGQICIDSDNVFHLLTTAHHLKLDEVKEFCFEFLENCMTPYNCITILITAKQYKNFTLRDKVYKHISDNYEKITQTTAFLNLENDELFFIVFHLKTRFYVNDEELCRSLLSWTKQDEETRKLHLQSRLIKFVNVDQLSYCYVKNLLNEILIQKIPDFLNTLNTRIDLLKLKGTKIVSVGGYYSKTEVKVIYSLDNDDASSFFPDLPMPVLYHRALKLKDSIYCVGGRTDKKLCLNEVFKIALKEERAEWLEIAPMSVKRQAPGAAVLGNALVVCGGYGGESYLSSAESYDPNLNVWNQISPFVHGRRGSEAVTSNGNLYAMGGWDKQICLSSVERLDGLDQSWKSVSSMQTPRFVFAAVECCDFIYAIGGMNDDLEVINSVEKYDCAADKWIYVSQMNIERRGHSACVMQGKIFVVGGWNAEDKPVKEIECYDPLTDKWEIVQKSNYNLCGNSLVVL